MTTITIITAEDLRPIADKLETILHILSKNISPNEKQWLRSNQVRQLLGNISPGKLQELRNNGLPYQRVGGTILYDPVEIDNWIKSDAD